MNPFPWKAGDRVHVGEFRDPGTVLEVKVGCALVRLDKPFRVRSYASETDLWVFLNELSPAKGAAMP